VAPPSLGPTEPPVVDDVTTPTRPRRRKAPWRAAVARRLRC